ncbi:MAG: DUF2723 domain-containing protein [bacterium]
MNKVTKYFPAFAFLISIIIYWITSAPDLMFTDSGELAVACSRLGVAHPTGYPLFTLLGFFWVKITPFLTPIRSLNLLSGIYTALSAGLFYSWVLVFLQNLPSKKKIQPLETSKIQLIALVLSLLYAFSGTVWSQATSIEVYPLHLLMLNLILYFTLKGKYSKANSNRWFLLAALSLGLSFANHATTILIVPAVLYLYFSDKSGRLEFSSAKFKGFALLLLPMFLGLSLYLYLPIRSSMTPDFNWGEVHRSLDKLLYHITGKQYQVWMFNGFSAWKTNLNTFIGLLPTELAYVGILTTLLGMFVVYSRSKLHFYLPMLMLVCCVIYTFNYGIHDIESYFLTAFIALFVFTAYALIWIFEKFSKYVLIAFALPVIAFVSNFAQQDESQNYTVPEYKKLVINSLAPNALIISSQWDLWFSAFMYDQLAEHKRPDIIAIDKELLRRTWYRDQIKHQMPEFYKKIEKEYDLFFSQLELFEEDKQYNPQLIQLYYENLVNKMIDVSYDERPVYVTIDVLQSEPGVAKTYGKVPHGLAIMLTKETYYRKPNIAKLDITKIQESMKGKDGHLYQGSAESISSMLMLNAQYAANNRDFVTARTLLTKSLALWPQNTNAISLYNAIVNL